METTKLNDGGPAFPSDNYRSDERGMTLRDYFAASAPPAPDWFKAKLTPLPKEPEGAAFCEGCKGDQDCHGTLPCISMKEHRQKEHATRELNKMETLIQWRWIYAESMIAARTPAAKALDFADESSKEAADKIDNLLTAEEIKLDASNAAYHVKIEAKPKDKPFTHTQER